ncbi:MAG: FtsK/SpoIIIE domain-containing protein [Phycisphaerales bacterium]|nr:FtsK/SpoIIIE domain-containing protein [Phycisphaerales bacterium]
MRNNEINKLTYQAIFGLIKNINAFAEQSDRRIQQLWSNFNASKQRLAEQRDEFMKNAAKEREDSISSTRKKAASLKDGAEKLYREVGALESSIAAADKHYAKTRADKSHLLTRQNDTSTSSETDPFAALKTLKDKFEKIAAKYRQTKPGMMDNLHYLFSGQRKQDYVELIVLKNTLAKMLAEVDKNLQELVGDSIQSFNVSHANKTSVIQSKYQAKLDEINKRYENDVEAAADEICRQLDNILPDRLLHAMKIANELYPHQFSGITIGHQDWDGTVAAGYVDYPLELFVNSKVLFSLIKDKCAAIVAHGKLLRFPLIFSLKSDLNLLVKHTADDALRNRFISSIMQSFIASVPVARLAFTVIDTEKQGASVSQFADFLAKRPELFDGGIVTSKDRVEESLEKLNGHIQAILRFRLGDAGSNLFECPESASGEAPEIKVLVVLDSPNVLGEKNVALINQIIENGSRCGVYALIGYCPPAGGQQGNTLSPYHEKRCAVIQQAVDMLLFFHLHVTWNEIPTGKDLTKYASKYSFLYDVFHRNAALSNPEIQKLFYSENLCDAQEAITSVNNGIEPYKKMFGAPPSADLAFPAAIPVSSLSYPFSIVTNRDIISKLKVGFISSEAATFELPAIFGLGVKNNLLITCPEFARSQIEKLVHGVMWSFLSFMPVAKVNFCVFDAEHRGNSIAPFLDFRQKLPEIFDGQIYTTQDAMVDRLKKLNRQMDEFIQEKLANRFENIVEYNLHAPSRAEPITLLVIFDFPRHFDGRNMELLLNVLGHGGKCGIHTIICHNPSIAFSKYESMDEHLREIAKHSSLIEYVGGKCVLQPYDLQINAPPEMGRNRVGTFVDEYAKTYTDAQNRGLSFEDVIRPPYFTASTAEKLSIPLGIGDGENAVDLVLGGEGSSHHGIIAGATGSGKSTLLHTIIMSGMLRYSPDELHLYLMDFKGGTEFKTYESTKPPHIQLLALDAMQEFGESILEHLVSEMLRRSDLFKKAKQSKLADYVNATGEALPRILVIMDEFQILFNDSTNRKIAMHCAELTKRIVTEGRSFGIHLLMATQTTKVISELTLSQGVIEQMRVRIGMKCGEDDARYLFGDRNSAKALGMMNGPIGTAVMNPEYMESNNIGLRVVHCGKVQKQLLELISKKYGDRSDMLVFEGDRTIPLLDYLQQNRIGVSSEPMIKIHLGTPIKVAPPFVMQFDRRRRHNLLICGANEQMAENLGNLCMLTALINTNVNVRCIDGESLIGEDGSAELYDYLTGFTPLFKAAKNREEIIRFVNDVHSAYLERKNANDGKQTLFVIKNLQLLDVVKKMFKGERVEEPKQEESKQIDVDDSSLEKAFELFSPATEGNATFLSVTEKLLQLVEDGSNYGVFFVVTSLEYQSVKESMHYGGNVLAKFPERIIFALGDNDSEHLIDGVKVSGLRSNIVYFTDGIKTAFQFKPYVMPNVSELASFIGGSSAASNVRPTNQGQPR